jgi:hypothetical protein
MQPELAPTGENDMARNSYIAACNADRDDKMVASAITLMVVVGGLLSALALTTAAISAIA